MAMFPETVQGLGHVKPGPTMLSLRPGTVSGERSEVQLSPGFGFSAQTFRLQHQLDLLGQWRRILPQSLLLLLLVGEILFPLLNPGALPGSLQDGGGVKGTHHLSEAGQTGHSLLGETETHLDWGQDCGGSVEQWQAGQTG